MIDVLERGEARENVTHIVILSTSIGTMGARNGLDRDTIGWSYIPVYVY